MFRWIFAVLVSAAVWSLAYAHTDEADAPAAKRITLEEAIARADVVLLGREDDALPGGAANRVAIDRCDRIQVDNAEIDAVGFEQLGRFEARRYQVADREHAGMPAFAQQIAAAYPEGVTTTWRRYQSEPGHPSCRDFP